MKDIKVTDSVKYIGVDDHDIDLFESQYVVPNGVSYNSYVILDEKVAVMDTVDARKTDEWLVNLEEALDGRNVDYIVVSHMEPDHAASLQVLAEKYPEAKVVGNAKTFNMIPQFFTFDLEGRKVVVKEGDTLSLGSHTLQFVMAPMVHWPEVMVAYETSEKILFSADGFGKFGALDADEDWACEARRYYFNICGKYGVQVQNLLKKAAGLDIEIICPLHGPILKENLGYYIGLYDTWSKYEPENEGILIAPSSINFLASSKELIPPAALIFTFSPTYFLNKAISSNVAPDVENPVDVLMKSAPASVTISHILIFSSSVNRHVSMITFNILSPHALFNNAISPLILSKCLSLTSPKLMTISISSAPFNIASFVSYSLTAVVLYPFGNPITVQIAIFPST